MRFGQRIVLHVVSLKLELMLGRPQLAVLVRQALPAPDELQIFASFLVGQTFEDAPESQHLFVTFIALTLRMVFSDCLQLFDLDLGFAVNSILNCLPGQVRHKVKSTRKDLIHSSSHLLSHFFILFKPRLGFIIQYIFYTRGPFSSNFITKCQVYAFKIVLVLRLLLLEYLLPNSWCEVNCDGLH